MFAQSNSGRIECLFLDVKAMHLSFPSHETGEKNRIVTIADSGINHLVACMHMAAQQFMSLLRRAHGSFLIRVRFIFRWIFFLFVDGGRHGLSDILSYIHGFIDG